MAILQTALAPQGDSQGSHFPDFAVGSSKEWGMASQLTSSASSKACESVEQAQAIEACALCVLLTPGLIPSSQPHLAIARLQG